MKESIYPLWNKRKSLPHLKPFQIIIMAVLTVALSALTVVGIGGMFCIGIAGAVFGLLLCTVHNLIPWMTMPVSFIAAFALSGDILASTCVLLYVPVGVAIAYSVFTRRGLTLALTIVTAATFVAVFANLSVMVVQLYEGGIRECYKAFGADVEALFRESFASIKYPGADGTLYSLPKESIDILIESAVMIMPAVAVITCELIAYISIRITRLGARFLGMDALLFGSRYFFTISVPASAVYICSVLFSLFSTEASVIAYSAINISYIIMPVACGAGFNMLLGKYGIIRSRFSSANRVFIISICVFMLLMSPLSFVQVLSMFSTVYTLCAAVSKALKDRRKNNDTQDR